MITLGINKIKRNVQILGKNSIEHAIYDYYNYCDCNDYSNLKCPCCGNKLLTFYKKYERNLTYYYNGEIFDITIDIAVCKCNHCSKILGRQKYHAILPEFVLPYIIYEASTIMKALEDYYNKVKINQILERLKIQHKIFYDWINKFRKYALSVSIVLKINNDFKLIINNIVSDNTIFLMKFYNDYNHPYFLFRTTCVPLCIIP